MRFYESNKNILFEPLISISIKILKLKFYISLIKNKEIII